jgi:hypothetical protein
LLRSHEKCLHARARRATTAPSIGLIAPSPPLIAINATDAPMTTFHWIGRRVAPIFRRASPQGQHDALDATTLAFVLHAALSAY